MTTDRSWRNYDAPDATAYGTDFLQARLLTIEAKLLQAALHKSHSACEAGVSIKPGAQAPGSDHKRQAGARETGDSMKFPIFRPLSRAPALLFGTLTWGLRPRLYAYACFAG